MFGETRAPWDVVILGAGPAGLAVAAACGARGLVSALVATDPAATWQNSYGCWEIGALGLGLEASILARFERPLVRTDDVPPRALDATYLRLDTQSLQQELLNRCRDAAVSLLSGTVSHVEHSANHSTVVTTEGDRLVARLVIDATGVRTRFSTRSRIEPTAYQSAYGLWLDTSGADGGSPMTLMDWSPLELPHEPASFLYAIPEREGRLFVQETCLASRQPVPFSLLAQRLELRISRLRLNSTLRLGVEHCVIPMGSGLPLRAQQVLPFGAAAGFIHPATGYQLTRSLRAAPLIAAAIQASLPQGRQAAVDRALEVMWPTECRNQFALYQMGLEIILGMSPAQLRSFMTRFFRLPTPLWLGFMEGSLPTRDIASAMWRVFTHSPTSLRLQLLQHGALSGSRALISAIA